MKITANNLMLATESNAAGEKQLIICNQLFSLTIPIDGGIVQAIERLLINANAGVDGISSTALKFTLAEFESLDGSNGLGVGELTIRQNNEGDIDVFDSESIGYCGSLHINSEI